MKRLQTTILALCLAFAADVAYAQDPSDLFETACINAQGNTEAAVAAVLESGWVEIPDPVAGSTANRRAFREPRPPARRDMTDLMVIGTTRSDSLSYNFCTLLFDGPDLPALVSDWSRRIGWAPEGDGRNDGDVSWTFSLQGSEFVRELEGASDEKLLKAVAERQIFTLAAGPDGEGLVMSLVAYRP